MSVHGADDRFLRPLDVRATPRNRRRIQARRLLVLLANLALLTVLATGGVWLYQRTQEDERFAIRGIEVRGLAGDHHGQIQSALEVWRGENLFRLEMPSLRAQLLEIDWIEDVAIEKLLPDGLRVGVTERVPKAILLREDRAQYLDAHGVAFGDATMATDYRVFPLVEGVDGPGAARCVDFLARLESEDPALYSRVASIRPAGESGWEIEDLDLRITVRVDEARAISKWRMLYGIVAAEQFRPESIEYADLRFDRRIVVKHHVPGNVR
jgi:cell division septal protein FtsQ